MQISDKKQLRAYYKKLRQSMSAAEKKNCDDRITAAFLESELYKKCDELLVYVSFDIEVDTLEIIKKALGEKKVFCPRCVSGTNIMEFYHIESFDDLEAGSYGLLEPVVDTGPVQSFSDNSVCIVPGLSFDDKGYRLGFGKGFYDRFLADFNGSTVGICYDSCLQESLPADEFDICVQHLITESKNVSFGLRKEEIYG